MCFLPRWILCSGCHCRSRRRSIPGSTAEGSQGSGHGRRSFAELGSAERGQPGAAAVARLGAVGCHRQVAGLTLSFKMIDVGAMLFSGVYCVCYKHCWNVESWNLQGHGRTCLHSRFHLLQRVIFCTFILPGVHLSRCPAKFGAFGGRRKTQSAGAAAIFDFVALLLQFFASS